MSRIGKTPIKLPAGTTIFEKEGVVTVQGPKGNLQFALFESLTISVKADEVIIARTNDNDKTKALHGLLRSLLNNAVIGVNQGFSKRLELVGTGYRVKKEAEKLVLSLGFSHPVLVDSLAGIKFEIEGDKEIIVSGINNQLVGQVAANIRSLRPPEPYKGKGIRYKDEIVRRKAGKAAKVGSAA